MKLQASSEFRLWLPVSKTWADCFVDEYATFYSVSIRRKDWALPSVLDHKVKKTKKPLTFSVQFFDKILQEYDN